MRMRNKPWAESEIASNSFVAADTGAGEWNKLFGNQNPLHVEIGMGKGRFIAGKAAVEPSVNFIGLERQQSVFASAARKIRMLRQEIPNLRIVLADASSINELFGENEISRIYINFCDPWPKKKWEKRRLTHGDYLASYEKILKSGGEIQLKTDSAELFRFSVNELSKRRWRTFKALKRIGQNPLEAMSEYEAKFTALGNDIYEVFASSPI